MMFEAEQPGGFGYGPSGVSERALDQGSFNFHDLLSERESLPRLFFHFCILLVLRGCQSINHRARAKD